MSLQVWLPLTKDLRNQGLNNITVVGNGDIALTSDGKLGGCYTFDGVDDSINIGNLATLVGSEFSFSCWFYHDNTWSSKSYETIFGGPSGFELEGKNSSTNSPIIKAYSWGGGTFTYELNKWNHLVMIRTSSATKFYLNGELKLTGSAGSIPSGNYFIGSWKSATSQNFKGKINDVRIYDHCLSIKEIEEIGKGLVLHYKLNNSGMGNENLLARYVVPGSGAPTSTAAGGRTTWLGDYKITIPATENADTYFRLFTTKQLTTNTIYTISCKVDGLLNGSYYKFPLYAQNNTSMGVLNLDHNGLCSLTFTMTYGTQTAATGANGETVYICFMDDSARTLASGQGPITLYDFKLEEGSNATLWSPNSTETFLDTMIEYDCSGYNNHGTRIGTFTWANNTPKYQISTHIGSTATKIHISNFPTSGFGNSYSFAWWGKRSSNSPMFWGFSNGIRLNGMYGGTLWNTGDGSSNPIYKPGTTTTITAPSVNTWHHYVMTGDGTICKLYVDGVHYGTANTYKAISGTSIYINGWDSSTSYCSDNTDISDFRIYATALSPAQVQELYNISLSIGKNATIFTGEVRENE